MPETMIEIPELQQGESWVPPVITEQAGSNNTLQEQSSLDIFFAQYAVCVILVTLVLLLRLGQPFSAEEVETRFLSAITQPDVPWLEDFLMAIRSLWS